MKETRTWTEVLDESLNSLLAYYITSLKIQSTAWIKHFFLETLSSKAAYKKLNTLSYTVSVVGNKNRKHTKRNRSPSNGTRNNNGSNRWHRTMPFIVHNLHGQFTDYCDKFPELTHMETL